MFNNMNTQLKDETCKFKNKLVLYRYTQIDAISVK